MLAVSIMDAHAWSDSSFTFWIHRSGVFSSSAALTTSSRRLRITLWLNAVIPIFRPARTSEVIMRAPV